jgi:hypothetical protein
VVDVTGRVVDRFTVEHSAEASSGWWHDWAGMGTRACRRWPSSDPMGAWWTGCCGKGACLEVKMPPGRGTMVSLSQAGGWTGRAACGRKPSNLTCAHEYLDLLQAPSLLLQYRAPDGGHVRIGAYINVKNAV